MDKKTFNQAANINETLQEVKTIREKVGYDMVNYATLAKGKPRTLLAKIAALFIELEEELKKQLERL
jgi:hypothetical protein